MNINGADADPDDVQFKPFAIELTAKAMNLLDKYRTYLKHAGWTTSPGDEREYVLSANQVAAEFTAECSKILDEMLDAEMDEDARIELAQQSN